MSNEEYVLVPKSSVKTAETKEKAVKSNSQSSVESQSTSSVTHSLSSSLTSALKSSMSNSSKLGKTTVKLVASWDPTLTTGTKTVAAKLDITGSSEFTALAGLYDEFSIDSVTVTQVFDNSTIAQANALGVSGVAIDINSDGSTPLAALTLLQMQHNYLVTWLDPRSQSLTVRFKSTNSASGQWPSWQKTSLASSFYPGGVYCASNGFPSVNTTLHFLFKFTVSFRTRQ